MFKTLKLLLCAVSASALVLAGCGEKAFSQTESAAASPVQNTTAVTQPSMVNPAETTAPPATVDSAGADDGSVRYDSYAIKKNLNEIESTLSGYLDKYHFKGSLYTKIGNDFDYIRAKGAASKGAHIDNSIYSGNYMGSVTKLITAVAAMKLAEENKLDLNSSLEKYFPECAYAGKVTVKQLLTMTSGIPNYVDRTHTPCGCVTVVSELDGRLKDPEAYEDNKKAVLDWILSQKLTEQDADSFAYSDSNYFLLGEIIAAESEMPYEDYVQKTVFAPAYISKSGFQSDDNTASPYPGDARGEKLTYQGVGYASLGLISNVSDMLRLIDGLMSYHIIGEDAVREMFTDTGDGFGYGVFVNGDRVSCMGSVNSYSAKLSFTGDQSQVFVAVSNDSGTDLNFIHRLFRNYMLKYRN